MTCPTCRDTGIAHRAPYLGDLYTIMLCDCPAGKALAAQINEKMEKKDG